MLGGKFSNFVPKMGTDLVKKLNGKHQITTDKKHFVFTRINKQKMTNY